MNESPDLWLCFQTSGWFKIISELAIFLPCLFGDKGIIQKHSA